MVSGDAWDAIDAFEGEAADWWVRLEHLGRYLFAAGLLRREGAGRAIDAACGTGFGTAELAREGLAALGVDRDPRALARARERYAGAGAEFELGDLEGEEIAPGREPFDAAVCFETLEHLLEPEPALRALAARVRSGGTVVCSLPIRAAEGREALGLPANAAHRQLFSLEGSRRLLEGAGLEVEERLGQSLVRRLLKRELKLFSREEAPARPSGIPALADPEALRSWARLAALPSPEDVEESYSVVYVARTP